MQHSKFPLIVMVLLSLLMAGSAAYFAYQNTKLNSYLTSLQKEPTPAQTSESVTPTITTKDTKEIQWKTTNSMGAFSFDYPAGWHVAEIWRDPSQGGILIAIDPEPISTAPRGGPFSTFEITATNGLQNPTEEFNKRKASFNSENYTEIATETLNSEVGPIYYYKGKIAGEMLQG